MSEAVRRPVQKRDGDQKRVPPAIEAVVTMPWAPRNDDRRAILVNERTTVFDRPMLAVAQQAADEPEIVTALGPMPTQWTWDLVHCRLLSVHAIACNLARVLVPPTYRSFLGSLQPQEATFRHRRVLTDDDTKRLDWTMSRVDAWSEIDRAVLKGIMSGHKLSDVSKATYAVAARFGGHGLAKSSVHKRYRTDTATMASEWTEAREPIDQDTRECWLHQPAQRK